jgi:hypothetical protein
MTAPKWLPAACIGIGIAAGVLAMNNGLGLDTRVMRIVAGAGVAVVVALIALGIAHLLTKRRA